jgi:hypothetical protein
MCHSDARGALRALSAAALLIAASARGAESSGIAANIGYVTSGTIESGGVAGAPAISFQGVGDGTLTTGGTPFDLGRFVVATPTDGSSTIYRNTPFEISLLPSSIDGAPAVGTSPIVIQGWLNGTVGGPGASGVVMNFNSIPGLPGDDGMPHDYPSIAPPFVLGSTMNFLGWAGDAPGLLPTSGSSDLQGVIISVLPQPAPEPSTFLIFACAAGLSIVLRNRPGKTPR